MPTAVTVPSSPPSSWMSLVCGLTGEKCFDHEQAADFRVWLSAAIDGTPEPKPVSPGKGKKPKLPETAAGDFTFLSLLHLYRGFCVDALGKSEEAGADYDWVLKHADFADFHARAAACQAKPCTAKDSLLYLREASRGE